MPDIDTLMEAWPTEIEELLNSTGYGAGGAAGNFFLLPAPDLEMSLLEYVKVLCCLLDIPVYDNPVESLHLLFTLFLEFKNNSHFQDRFPDSVSHMAEAKDGSNTANGSKKSAKYGGADVLEIKNEEY